MKQLLKNLAFLHLVLLIYSGIAILSKTASSYELFSLPFFILYGLMLCCLGIYAILWQQALKHVSLGMAFANKAIVIIWGIIWGKFCFNEIISLKMIIGALIIVCGIVVVATEKQNDEAVQK